MSNKDNGIAGVKEIVFGGMCFLIGFFACFSIGLFRFGETAEVHNKIRSEKEFIIDMDKASYKCEKTNQLTGE